MIGSLISNDIAEKEIKFYPPLLPQSLSLTHERKSTREKESILYRAYYIKQNMKRLESCPTHFFHSSNLSFPQFHHLPRRITTTKL